MSQQNPLPSVQIQMEVSLADMQTKSHDWSQLRKIMSNMLQYFKFYIFPTWKLCGTCSWPSAVIPQVKHVIKKAQTIMLPTTVFHLSSICVFNSVSYNGYIWTWQSIEELCFNGLIDWFIHKLWVPSFIISTGKVHVFVSHNVAGFLWISNLYLLLRPD